MAIVLHVDPLFPVRHRVGGPHLQRRPSYETDVEKVLRAGAKREVAVEINAHPWRIDLD